MGLFDMFGGGKAMDAYVEEAGKVGATLVDVREVNEFVAGHVTGAINVPLQSLSTIATQKLTDKSAKLYVYCLSGARSARACGMLKSMGYTDVTNIGGINSYRGPVVAGN